MWFFCHIVFLEGLADLNRTRLSNNRSVMPLDVLGCTRATLNGSACFPCPIGPGNPLNPIRGRDWSLQLFSMNQEFPVSASHKLALITSLPFVHTARRYYRLDVLVRHLDWVKIVARLPFLRKDFQTWASRGSKSRNKVSVGEPAEGSLLVLPLGFDWVGEQKLACEVCRGNSIDRAKCEIASCSNVAIVCVSILFVTLLNCEVGLTIQVYG